MMLMLAAAPWLPPTPLWAVQVYTPSCSRVTRPEVTSRLRFRLLSHSLIWTLGPVEAVSPLGSRPPSLLQVIRGAGLPGQGSDSMLNILQILGRYCVDCS